MGPWASVEAGLCCRHLELELSKTAGTRKDGMSREGWRVASRRKLRREEWRLTHAMVAGERDKCVSLSQLIFGKIDRVFGFEELVKSWGGGRIGVKCN